MKQTPFNFGAAALAVLMAISVELAASPFDTWFPVNSGTTRLLRAVAYGGDTFVAVGQAGTILVSTNGLAWTDRTFIPTNSYVDVAYGAGVFVAIQSIPGLIGRSGGIVRSEDGGQTWEAINLNRPWSGGGVTYGFGKFVAVGGPTESGSGFEGVLVSSDGGRTWSGRDLGSAGSLNDVTFGVRAGTFVALEDNSQTWTSFSLDASDWEVEDIYFGRLLGCAYGGNYSEQSYCVAVGHNDKNSKGIIRRSYDFGRWWLDVSPSFGLIGMRLQGVGYGAGTFVAVGESGTLLTSTNGETWNVLASITGQTLRDAGYGRGRFVVVGDGGTILAAHETPTLVVTAPERVTITYGQPVGIILTPGPGFVANANGSWAVIAPPPDTVLMARSDQPVTVRFTPDDTRLSPATMTLLVDVLPAPLTIAASSHCRHKGAMNPAFAAGYGGFVNQEGPEDLDIPVNLSTPADANSDFGVYPVIASGAADSNYQITYIFGTLRIDPDACDFPISIVPSNCWVVDGYLLSFSAVGRRSDGTTVDLTQEVDWLGGTTTALGFARTLVPEPGMKGSFRGICLPGGIGSSSRLYAKYGGVTRSDTAVEIRCRPCITSIYAGKFGCDGITGLAVAGADPNEVLSGDDLHQFYALRELMRETEAGASLVDLFYQHTGEVLALALANAPLRAQIGELLVDFLPGVQALLSGRGQEVSITVEQIAKLNAVCDHFAAAGSEELAVAVNLARARFDRLQDFEDGSFEQWRDLLGLAEPVSILRSAVLNGQFQAEAKAVPGLSYTLLRSGDLTPGSWTAVSGLLTMTNGFRVTLTDPAPPASQSFYRLEANSE